MKQCSDKIKHIESNYPVDKIRYCDIRLWGVIRIYLFDKMLSLKTNGVIHRKGVSCNSLKVIFKGLFYYNPLKIFQKWDIWLFVAADRRKIIDDVAIHRVSGIIPEIHSKTLVIEKPFPKFHFSKSQVREKHIISESFFFVLIYFCELIYRWKRPRIENEEIIIQVINDYGAELNYKDVVYRFLAQYTVMKMILRVVPKPKAVFIEVPYTLMGYVLAFKYYKIDVLEMQHGVINENHYAYNSILKNEQYLPDKLLVYGDIECECFEKYNRCYVAKDSLIAVGSYILEKINNQPPSTMFNLMRKMYNTIVVVAAQELIENRLIDFINDAAKLDASIFYAYVPRQQKDYTDKIKALNIQIISGNIYEIIKEGDIHTTVFSTTCLEAQYLGKMNIFMDIDQLSSNYYRKILTDKDGAYYACTPGEFVNLIHEHYMENIKFESSFFAKGHKRRMELIMNQYV